jgi:acyl-CoA thioesterase-1
VRRSKAALTVIFLGLPAAAEPVTLLALGDSLTQGYGLPADQGFVPQLETWLNANGAEVSVVNGGVSGDTSAGGASRIGWALEPSVDAVMVALGGNDLLRGIDPAATKGNLATILTEIEGRGLPVLLVGMSALGNYGAAYAEEFNAIYPTLAEAHDVALFDDFLAGLEQIGDRQQVLSDYLQPDAVHPNADGVALIVEAIGPTVLELVGAAD